MSRPFHKVRLGVSLIVVAVGIVIYANRLTLQDAVKLYNYQPSARLSQLASDDGLTALGRKYLYVNHPELRNRTNFSSSCKNQDEQSIILGCYYPVDNGIFLFSVDDSRLHGVEQVTAAHEMLHAAYDHLTSNERSRVDGLLQSYFAHDLHDNRIQTTIAAYQKSEPNDVINEMHSIFGTEIADLPDPLRQYYKQYFTDRSAVVGYATSYQSEFTSRQDAVKRYDKQLMALRATINTQTASLTAEEKSISDARAQLDQLRKTNVASYNANVPTFNSAIDGYNNHVTTLKESISAYNALVQERNATAVEVQDLARSIDSNPTSIHQ